MFLFLLTEWTAGMSSWTTNNSIPTLKLHHKELYIGGKNQWGNEWPITHRMDNKHCLKISQETLLNCVSNDLLPFMVGQSHYSLKLLSVMDVMLFQHYQQAIHVLCVGYRSEALWSNLSVMLNVFVSMSEWQANKSWNTRLLLVLAVEISPDFVGSKREVNPYADFSYYHPIWRCENHTFSTGNLQMCVDFLPGTYLCKLFSSSSLWLLNLIL
jgi:hypothetical protein